MYRSTTRKKPLDRTTFPASTSAPTAGLNSRDPLQSMQQQYAINLTNFLSTPQGVSVREGYRDYATGIEGYVNTLMPYNAVPPASDKLFAAAGTRIYNATQIGPASESITGLLSSQWSHINFTGTAGHYLIACNGVDAPRHWNGSNWVTWTYNASPTTPGQIGGISDPVRFESVISHQKRLWFVEKNSTVAWYLPINSIGGAAISFDFGALFPRGGTLTALTSWSMNGGTGMQNYLVAISSSGDTVIYDGTDPSDSTKWALKGTWRLGAPVGNRCFLAFGGDTLLLSQDGLMPLSKYMQQTTNEAALTDSIRPTLATLTNTQRGLPGFQIHDYLARNLLILNVPQINPDSNIQFIYNTITGGWSLFTGWPAQCWATLGDSVYFGNRGSVSVGFVGYKDAAETDGQGGNTYTATAQQAFSYFEKPGIKKRFVRAKVNLLSASGRPNVRLACRVDWATDAPQNVGSATAADAATWGSSIFGASEWSGAGLVNSNDWQTLGPIGYAGSLVIAVSVLSETVWLSTEWELEPGGSH
ncbi:hypothetical protein LE191_04205 [Janthinobacterium sp. HSC-3S05]|uniref:hypothetical protein n=1 Tax=Janthinobacterium lividum TaxID=29581 RepID=UPI001CD874C7|nr:hypothetical protein [Janthinobacterium lividum]MCA1859312.1 hypothetical protein [Janthinobacterium lividum]